MSHVRARLIGLSATVGLAGWIVGVPVLLLAVDASPSLSGLGWADLSARDDGSLALALSRNGAWLGWAVFTLPIALDIAFRARGQQAPRLPGMATPQRAAGRLVGLAALLFIAVPTVVTVADAPRTAAQPASTPAPSPASPAIGSPTESRFPESAPAGNSSTERYRVRLGDSLWKIASERLGDGRRYVELVALNQDVLDGEPDFLTPGTVLRIPVASTDTETAAYIVEPGDTLSEIAERELGNAAAYPEIVEASRATVQPDGSRLTDPDLIRPGWRLTLPGQPEVVVPHGPGPRADQAPEDQPSPAEPPLREDLGSSDAPDDHSEADSPSAAETDGPDLPSWVLPGLAGAGTALAGALLLVLRQHRRTQLRQRRPGHIIAPPPAELRAVEKSAQASGSITAPRVDELGRALCALANATAPAPQVVIATLRPDSIEVVLTTASTLPAPWHGGGTKWAIRPHEVPSEQPGSVAPYPLIVSIGMNDDGALVYVNLEELRTVALTGETSRCIALGRHIAAELSLNPWSTQVEIDTVGLGDELTTIDQLRLRQHPGGDTRAIAHLLSDLEAEDSSLEPDQFRVVIATDDRSGDHGPGDEVRMLAKVVASYSGRSGAAVVAIGSLGAEETEIRLTEAGRLRIDTLGLDLVAAGLTAEEAQASATLVDLTRDATNLEVPLNGGSTGCSDAGGALLPELTEPRPEEKPAGTASLMPLTDRQYVDAAAVVAEDLDALAPLASAEAAARVTEEDPDLDEDLARWQASSLAGPRLILLGPVSARTLGDPRAMAHRRPFYVELLSFLALHPGGVTADEVAEAFGIRTDRARKDLGVLRGWLGRDPKTGQQHLPNARQTHANGVRAKYAVNGVATDFDLFRRLRARGQSRGADGIDDLRAALTLVSGEPFTDLRPSGWGWLLEGERFDHLISCAIVDTGHIITSQALAIGDIDLARFSAEVTYKAAPYDEVSRLDVIAVAKALGHDDEVERLLTEGVLNRSDDDLGPIDLPERTTKVLHQNRWTSTRPTQMNRATGSERPGS